MSADKAARAGDGVRTSAASLSVRVPLVLQLAGPARIEALLDPQQGATVKIAGKLERREGLTGDVVLTLTEVAGRSAFGPGGHRESRCH